MLKISYAACLCLSHLITAQFALEMCLAAQNRPKKPQTPIMAFEVIRGHWVRRQSRVRLPIND